MSKKGKQTADQDADHSAHSAQRDRFERELKHDVLSGRAQRLTDTYLPRSFRHAHQHDVHHAHAADH